MLHMLVLDDKRGAGVLIQRTLEDKGREVYAFTDKEEAIAFSQSAPVDLAILDIGLRKMSGIEVLESFKRINLVMHAMILAGYPSAETS